MTDDWENEGGALTGYREPDPEYPRLFPTVEATDQMVESDLDTHGCAYVVEIAGKDWMVHPNQLTVYGKPKRTKVFYR